MSKIEDESIGFTIAEKFFALLIILIGILILYSVSTSTGLVFPLLFNLGGAALVVIGVIMILAKST